jgi:tRNA 2-selenouridine synthase
MQEYAHFLADPDLLGKQLDCLLPLHGHAVIERWKTLAAAGEWDALVEELLVRHYDPAYNRSIVSHYPSLPQARAVQLEAGGEAAFASAASRLMDEAPEAVT